MDSSIPPIIEVSNVSKSYGRKQILTSISFQAAQGECIGILGVNGCGKSTLLAILAGCLRADGGTICFRGNQAIKKQDFLSMAGYVPQENPLIEELTVKDNLSLWYQGNKKRMEEDLKQGAAAMLGIGDMLKKPAGTLSGGMKKRLSIACALSNHASVLILDEPGAALDLECKALIRRYLKEYQNQGGTVLLTSHELPELSLCTKMYLLKEGKMRQIETGMGEQELIRAFQREKE